ncbi:hypothetical protein R5R35_000943 [Gryllus longicercus]|uniref:Uncharacterized protein n=1 Tax=Gryllus longicercus TaxID=2509291 RepID=A0AAN9V758_9ORTH
MEMVSRKEIQYRCEYPVAPIRHKDVMDKLARCRFCDCLCCCLEHLVEHENRHVIATGKRPTVNEESKCSSELSGWVEATEHVLLSRRKINFPLFCIYCKITVRNEHELRHLMTIGPRCSLKESHWIISFKKYLEKSRDRKISLVFEETEKKTVDRSLSFVSANVSVNNQLTHPQPFTPRENSSRSLGRMKPISTSTPQDGCEPSGTSDKDISSAATEQTPIGSKTSNAPHSILAVKNDQKPKGESVRKVTFSCIVETTNNSSIKANSNDDQIGNEKEVHDNKNSIHKKLGENKDYLAEKNQYKQEEKIEKFAFKNEDDKQFLSKNVGQNNCDDKSDVENKTNVVLKGNEKQFKDTDESLGSLDGMELIDKSNKTVNEHEGKELEDAECKLENDGHGELEVSINSEMSNKDRIDDKTFEISTKEKEGMLDNHEEMDSQNNTLDESGENSSQLNFYSEEESRNETNLYENESFGSIDFFKAFRDGNTEPRVHKAASLSFQDSLDIDSSQFSTGQTFTITSKLQEQIESNDSNDSKPQFIENELQIDERASEEDSDVSSHDHDDKATSSPCTDGHDSSDEQLSNESNIDEDWGLTKLKTALSYSWGKAKELVMQSWGTKRDTIEEEENDENCAKRMKMTHSCSRPDPDPNPNSSFPVQWKCSRRPVRSTEYLNISKRRPLSRMMKK